LAGICHRPSSAYPGARVPIACTISNEKDEEASVIARNLYAQYEAPDKLAWGYDAQKGDCVNAVGAGIMDQPKVVRIALMGAFGVASLPTTSEACVDKAPEDKPTAGSGMSDMIGVGSMGEF
jgi:chaperonin GroEL